ncbi:MAG TPA: hypothetical protein VFF73_31560 [Planctomycetota bacterium]|nr:hypothetical protein [Planctomycetota bacterium]
MNTSIPAENDKTVVSHGMERKLDLAMQGLQTAIPAGVTQLSVGQVTYQIADLLTKAKEVRQPWKDARAAHATLRSVTQSRPQDTTTARNFLADLKVALVGLFGRESQDLTTFGFKPQKTRTPLTSAQKVQRAAKAKATRQKRGTMGSRQKANIRATETPSVTIDPNGTVVATPAEAPAPPASPGSNAKTA